MRFEWDEEKNQINIEKHGFDFADAYEIFEGPVLTALDIREDYGEDRWIGIGFLEQTTAVIVYTIRVGDVYRIISLRKALTHEKQRFEAFLTNRLG